MKTISKARMSKLSKALAKSAKTIGAGINEYGQFHAMFVHRGREYYLFADNRTTKLQRSNGSNLRYFKA